MPTQITNEVLAERIGNLSDMVITAFKQNANEHENIKISLQQEITEIRDSVTNNKKEIRQLQDWRLVFVTKFTVYSTMALFIGTIISQLLIKWADKLFNW